MASTSSAGSAKRKRVSAEGVGADIIDIECPVCMELMTGTINQCAKGHTLCGACTSKVTTCPSCRCDMDTENPIRNLLGERLAAKIKVPCEHEGCSEVVPAKELKEHMAACEYRPYKCPSCEEEVAGAELRGHIEEEHREIVDRIESIKIIDIVCNDLHGNGEMFETDASYFEAPGGGKELLVLDVSVGHKGMDYDGLTDYVKDARGCLNVCVRQLVKRSQPRMVTVHLLDGNRTALPGRGERCRRVMQSFEAQSLRRGLQDIVDDGDCMSVGVDLLKKMMYKNPKESEEEEEEEESEEEEEGEWENFRFKIAVEVA